MPAVVQATVWLTLFDLYVKVIDFFPAVGIPEMVQVSFGFFLPYSKSSGPVPPAKVFVVYILVFALMLE